MSGKGPHKKNGLLGKGDSGLQHLHDKVREVSEKGTSLFYGEAKVAENLRVPDGCRGICASPSPELPLSRQISSHEELPGLGDLQASPSKDGLISVTDERSEPWTKPDDDSLFLPDVFSSNLTSTMTIEGSGLMSSLVQSSGEGRVAPWNPMLWLEARQQLLDDGRIKELPNLMRFVRESSRRALQMKGYQTSHRGKTINLGKCLMPAEGVRWLGRRNVKVPQMPEGTSAADVQPPIIVVSESPLDVIYRMTHSGPAEDRKRPIIMVVEATDFDEDGRLNVGTTRTTSMSHQNLLVRSDFQRFARQAGSCIRNGKSSVRDHLTATHDPYVFTCPNVTMFRGARDDGYPYLEKPVHFTCIVCAMPSTRPAVIMAGSGLGPKSEWYSSDLDQTALLERLCLIGYAALQDVDTKQKAILVLSALGCTDRGLHPRDAVANSMKHWRTKFSKLFHTVFLATGQDRDLAEQFDLAINRQLYSSLLTQDVSNFVEWHWSSHHVSMHVNSVDLHVIADMVEEETERKEEERKKLEAEQQAKQEQQDLLKVELDNERRERTCMQREDKLDDLFEEDAFARHVSGDSIGSQSDGQSPSHSRHGSKKHSATVLDIHAQVGRAGSKRASQELCSSARGSVLCISIHEKIDEDNTLAISEDQFDENVQSPMEQEKARPSKDQRRVTLLDDFTIAAIVDSSRHHVSKTRTEMQVENLYKNSHRHGGSNVLAPKISSFNTTNSARGSRANSVSDAHSHLTSRHSRQSMGSLVSARLHKHNENAQGRSRSGSLSGSSKSGSREDLRGDRSRCSITSRRKSSAASAHSRRQSALELRIRKTSALGVMPKSGCSSARSSAFGGAVTTAQCRTACNQNKMSDAQRIEQIRFDARRRLSNRKECEKDIESVDEDAVSPNSLSISRSGSLKFGGLDQTENVCTTTTIALPTSVEERASSPEANVKEETDVEGNDKTQTCELPPLNTSSKDVPDSPKDKKSPMNGSQPTSPRSQAIPNDKRLSVRYPEKMEEWEVRVNLHQLATAFKDSTDRFWNSPRRKKNFAPAPKPARRTSDIARGIEQQKAFETAMSEDLGHRQAEAEIKRAVKELGLDAASPYTIPGTSLQPQAALQPVTEHKTRSSQLSSLRAPVESPLLKKLALTSPPLDTDSTSTDATEQAQTLPQLSPLRRSYLANQRGSMNNHRGSMNSQMSSSPRYGAASSRARASRDISTVSEAKHLKPDVTDAHKLEDIGQSGSLMTF